MDLRNCKKCGRIYQHEGFDLCRACRKDLDNDFKVVKEYLDENPGASVPEVVEDTGISAEKIMRFLREDRLELKGEDGFLLECEGCRKPIPSGRFCSDCIGRLQSDFKSVTKKEVKEENPFSQSERDKFRMADRRNRDR